MISLDQVLLLQQKVESAVQKIAQLNAENDALRTKCSELTNALSAKTEQVSAFEADQNKIEEGILQALDRLNAVENSVLKAVGQVPSQAASTQELPVETPVQEEVPVPTETPVEEVQTSEQVEQPTDQVTGSVETSAPIEQKEELTDQPEAPTEPAQEQNLQFDIF